MSKKPLSVLIVLMCAIMIFACSALTSAAENEEAVPAAPEETVAPSEPEEPACRTTGEHVPGAWTCAGDGTHFAVCSLCGESISQPCDYGSPVVFTPVGDGTHEKTCVVCGGKESAACVLVDPVSTLPTQTEPGVQTRTCAVCGYVETTETAQPEGIREKSSLMGDPDKNGTVDADDARTILRAAIALEPIATDRTPLADLDEDGGITSSDARFALRIAIGLEPERRHEIKYEILITPNCTEGGAVEWSCAYCGFAETLNVPENGHKWNGPTADHAARCEVCGLTLTGWQTLNGSPVYYNNDGSVTKGRSLLHTDYQGKNAWWYLNNGVADPNYRGVITWDGADWIITGGTASKVTTAADRTLYRAFLEVEKATTPDMTQDQKLRACFVYCKKNFSECRPRTPHYTGIDWPMIYADDMFVGRKGNCCSYAAAFAFMAKAVGCENVYCCNSGGHGWAEINGRVFDPEWSKRDGLNAVTYYDLSYDAPCDVRYKAAISSMLPWMHVKI